MKRLAILLLAALVLPACNMQPSTTWGPGTMHWGNPNAKVMHQSASASEDASDNAMLGDASENGAMSDADAVDQTTSDTAANTEANADGQSDADTTADADSTNDNNSDSTDGGQ